MLEHQQIYGPLELSALKELFGSLAKTVKTVRQYPPHHQVAAKFYEALHERFANCLSTIEGISIEVSLDSFSCCDEIIYHSDSLTDNIASLLHRDGIRSIRFSHGLTNGEIDRFVDLLIRAGRDDEARVDIVNEIWEADLEHIQCEVIDDLEYGEIEDADSLREEFIEEGSKGMSDSGGIDTHLWSENVEEDQQRARNQEETARFTFGGLVRHTQADLQAIEKLVSDDRKRDVKRDVINLLLQLCAYEKSVHDLGLILESLQAAYDRLIRNGSFATLTEIVSGIIRLLSERNFESDRFERRLKEFYQRCGDMVRIKMITKRLNENPETDLEPVAQYFRLLGWESLNNMIWMLGELEHYRARRVLCDLLVEKGKNQIQLIGGAVYDSRWYVVRNVAMIIGETELAEGVAYLQRAARHADDRVRIEAARSLARIESNESAEALIGLLDDESERVRSAAVNGLARLKHSGAFERLRDLVTSEQFADREQNSMRQLLVALIRSDGNESLDVLVQLLKKSSFFKRARIRRMQEAVITALEAADRTAAEDILTAVASSSDSHLRELARKVQTRIQSNHSRKQALDSSKSPTGSGGGDQ